MSFVVLGKRQNNFGCVSPIAKRGRFQEECSAKLRFATNALKAKEEPFEQVLALEGDLCKVPPFSVAASVGAHRRFAVCQAMKWVSGNSSEEVNRTRLSILASIEKLAQRFVDDGSTKKW